jgi:hypothetical protein
MGGSRNRGRIVGDDGPWRGRSLCARLPADIRDDSDVNDGLDHLEPDGHRGSARRTGDRRTFGVRHRTIELELRGTCGWSIGLAYLGIAAAGFAALATTGKQPANCDECAIPGPSALAVLVAYIVGVTTGAVVGWNLSKVRKDESLALQPIFRAGPPPEALADWLDPTLRSSGRRTGDAMSVQVPLVAFAF